MKKEMPELEPRIRNVEDSFENGELVKAVKRIHNRYGNDLESFLNDIKESIHKRNAKTEASDFVAL